MGYILLALMIGVPIVEIAVFIEVGGFLGLWPTIAIVILTAIMGTALLRYQGFSVLARAQQSLEQDRFPLQEVFDGLCLLVAGALLLTPGFVTDGVGFALFFPPFRDGLRRAAGRYLKSSGRIHTWQTGPSGPQGPTQHGPTPHGPGPVIDGEYDDLTPGERGGERGADGEEKNAGPDRDDGPSLPGSRLS